MIHSAVDQHAVASAELSTGTVASGVSWAAILAGAFGAAALSFILVILGFGLGFSSVSPWSGEGLSTQTFGYSTIAWITLTQIAASAIGGYLAGRLRVKWAGVHTDEVYFRDTAHGFLAWAVAALATAALLSSAIGSVISGGAKVAGATSAAIASTGIAGGGANATDARNNNGIVDNMSGYLIDNLFRPAVIPVGEAQAVPPASIGDNPETVVTSAQRMEVARIFANAIQTGALPDADKAYLIQLLAKRSGISDADAGKRISEVYGRYKKTIDDGLAKAKQAADQARKAAAYGSLWMFVALLCGAFIASFCATYGGRMRDQELLSDTGSNTARQH